MASSRNKISRSYRELGMPRKEGSKLLYHTRRAELAYVGEGRAAGRREISMYSFSCLGSGRLLRGVAGRVFGGEGCRARGVEGGTDCVVAGAVETPRGLRGNSRKAESETLMAGSLPAEDARGSPKSNRG